MGMAGRNASTWRQGRFTGAYRDEALRPPEAALLASCAPAFAGRVLELGCGTGRVTAHLAERAEHVDAVDISPHMLAVARGRLPQVAFHELDLAHLGGFASGGYDAVMASFNVIDVLDDAGRAALLDELHRLLRPDGRFVFSSHNRAHAGQMSKPWHVPRHRLLAAGNAVARMPLRLRNHARLRSLEVRSERYDILNDSAHDFSLLHYYVAPDDQRRQLSEHGFELLECLGMDGTPVDELAPPPEQPELHYGARRR